LIKSNTRVTMSPICNKITNTKIPIWRAESEVKKLVSDIERRKDMCLHTVSRKMASVKPKVWGV
jgi:hypothetical protein